MVEVATQPENMATDPKIVEGSAAVPGKENGKEEMNDQSSTKAASGSENKANTETAAPELVNSNVQVPPAISGGEEKSVHGKIQENKIEQHNKEKADNIVSPAAGNSKKRKRKKVIKPKNLAPVKNTNAETPVSGNEQKVEEKKEEENKEGQNNQGKSAATGKNANKRKKKKAAIGSSNSVLAKDTDKPETSTKEDDSKRESMGMIFMCSSKTKQDCYRYKVLGLPAAKKDMVAKIYKGMRLFLFDIDLKLLYGIYKAAEPGGYNIEPKAFNSAFPSQVHFSVFEDCLPLAEEKFKAVIKDNYYGKNKFDCQLKAEQVKNLCKLFKANTGKSRESKPVERVRKPEARSFAVRSRERGHGRDRERRQGSDRDRRPGQERDRRQGRDRDMQRGRIVERRHGEDRGRHGAFRPDASSILPPRVPLAYGYERPMDIDYHRRDTHDRRLVDLELNRREEILYHDPYGHMEPPPPVHDRYLSYQEPYTRALPSHEPSLSRHELIYSRHPPPAHEAPVSYHESVYARDAAPVHLLPHAGYRY